MLPIFFLILSSFLLASESQDAAYDDKTIYIVCTDCPGDAICVDRIGPLRIAAETIKKTLRDWGAPFDVVVVDSKFVEDHKLPWRVSWKAGEKFTKNIMTVAVSNDLSNKKAFKRFEQIVGKDLITWSTGRIVDFAKIRNNVHNLSTLDPETKKNLKDTIPTPGQAAGGGPPKGRPLSPTQFSSWPENCDQLVFPGQNALDIPCAFAAVDLKRAENLFFANKPTVNLGFYLIMAGIQAKDKKLPAKYDIEGLTDIKRALSRRNFKTYYQYYIAGILLHEISHALNWTSDANADHQGESGRSTEFGYFFPSLDKSSGWNDTANGPEWFFNFFFSVSHNNKPRSQLPRPLTHVEALRMRYCGRTTSCI